MAHVSHGTDEALGLALPTVDGVETTIETEVKGIKRQRKVLRKIPPKVLQSACGLAIFTSFRSGIAPFGGAGGAGVVVARLEDGSWSAPSSMSPNSLTAGFMVRAPCSVLRSHSDAH